MPEGLKHAWHLGHNAGWLRRESAHLRIDLVEPEGIREQDIYPPGCWS